MIKKIAFSLLMTTSVATLAAGDTHTVARGETLYGIAARHHTSVEQILRHNSLRSATIHPGQKLSIPGNSEAQAGATTGAGTTYVVRRGDSLSSIASRHNTTVEALRHQNQLASHMLYPGQELQVPGRNASAAAQPVAKSTQAVHSIRRGDTLSAIAARHRISVAALARHNNLSTRSTLQVGQTLRIPAASTVVTPYRQPESTRALATGHNLRLESTSVILVDALSGKTLYEKNAETVKPIASITKLMTAMVVLDAKLPMTEELVIDKDDIDRLKGTSSRLPMGTKLHRLEMLRLALMSSENRAASALGRHYPGGKTAFIAAMNRKAGELGMTNTHFADSTGLTPKNVSTASDLVKMIAAASEYPLIREFTTTDGQQITVRPTAHQLQYINSNPLVRKGAWHIDVSKTGYINEAGRCLVMKASVANRPAFMVFLQSSGKYSPMGDAARIKTWIESGASGINIASL
ncbi:MAG: D-alanyl-D-alanine endopeptidase [Porticoccaceae bacterium]|jgi:D-alanyl-D-alanine endopeptidase (penicillin-binding protein 7)